VAETHNWGMGILNDAGEPWFIGLSEIQAVRLNTAKPINEGPVWMVARFNTDRQRYQVYVVYNPEDGLGQIRLSVEPFGSVE
jgi:hypothetical protein